MTTLTTTSISQIDSFIALLVSNWEKKGHVLGVDTYMQIQQVIKSLPGEVRPNQLKNYLAPILVSTQQEQKDFHLLFEQMLEVYTVQQQQQELLFHADEAAQQAVTIGRSSQKIIQRWRGFSQKIQLLIVLGFLTSIFVPVSLVSYFKQLNRDYLIEQEIRRDPIFQDEAASSATYEFNTPTAKPGPQKATPKLHPDSSSDEAQMVKDGSNFQENNPIYFESTKAGGLSFSTQHAYFSPAKGMILFFFTLSLILLGLWLGYKNRKFGFLPEVDPDLPNEWTIRIPFLQQVHMGEAFYLAVTDLRKRQASENLRLNLKQTVKATAEQAGMIDFKYSTLSESKDYLVLLDLGGVHNQRSKLSELIINALKAHEVPLTLFYYREDPQRCWNAQFREGISLRDLQHKYSTHRLILWDDAETLVGLNSKEMAIFDLWRQKIILNTKAVKDWGGSEVWLAQKFRMVPATPKGLAALVENLEAIEPKDPLRWKDTAEKNTDFLSIEDNLPAKDLLTILEKEFLISTSEGSNDALLKWLAACAMPPVLFWDWVQYAGQIITQNQSQQLLTLDSLYQITKLDWFCKGQIPESARLVLLNWLEEQHPYLAIKLRHEWLKIMTLETNLPPVSSLAWQGHRVQVILNQLLEKQQLSDQQKLEAELNQLLHSDQQQDTLLIQYLQQKKSGLDQLLSDRFRKFIQKRQGIAWKWRHWTWQLMGASVGFFLLLFSHFTEPVQVFKFNDYITDTAFAWDNRTFAVFAGDGSVSLCTTNNGWIGGIDQGFKNVVESAFSQHDLTLHALNEQGRELFCTKKSHLPIGIENGVAIFDTSWQEFEIYRKELLSLVTAGKYLERNGGLIGYYDGSINLNVTDKGSAYFRHNDAVRDVDALLDKELVLTCSNDNTARLWSFDGKLITTLTGHKDYVYTCCFSPDGKKIATAGRDETVILWNLNGKKLRTYKGHRGDINDLAFTKDSKAIISVSSDKTAKMWGLDGKLIRTFYGHKDKISTLSLSPDGTKLLTGSNDQTVRLWNLKLK